MRGEIKEKIEAKRQEIKAESERLRREATQNHICANCGSPLPSGKRTYCSDTCSMEFVSKFDYSADSEILRKYARKLKDEYDAAHPKEERQPWSQPVARKVHGCDFCGSPIQKGEKYERYVRLPEYDEWFDDAPYEALRYHKNCMEFMNLLSYAGLMDGEGLSDDEIFALLAAIAIESGDSYESVIGNIKAGKFPSTEFLEALSKEYEYFEPRFQWVSDHSGYRYAYSVRYESFNRPMARIHVSFSEIKDPANFFSDYYKIINGDEFNRFLSVKGIKIPLPKVEVMEGQK